MAARLSGRVHACLFDYRVRLQCQPVAPAPTPVSAAGAELLGARYTVDADTTLPAAAADGVG